MRLLLWCALAAEEVIGRLDCLVRLHDDEVRVLFDEGAVSSRCRRCGRVERVEIGFGPGCLGVK
ncbi:hypothetical protein SEA_MORGANA_82 [Gordonia phage Morgana]|uniref:DNA binding protein n=2 Tax=Cafassovirus TaxID=3425056 RepID=A0AAE7SFJ1_9CAUD|nr:DNA binding protein [Gordonia phage Cafasso]